MEEDVRIERTRTVLTVTVILIVLSATVGWRSIYARPSVIATVVLAGGVAGALLAVLGRRRRVPWLVGVGASVVVVMGLSLAGSPRDYASVGSALFGGWKELATTGLLAGSSPALLVPPVFTSVLGAFLATWLAWRRSTRPLAAGVALIPVVAAYAYTVDVARFPFWMAGLLTALVGLILLADLGSPPDGAEFVDGRAGSAHRRRSLVSGGAVVAAVSMLSMALFFPLKSIGRADQPFGLRSWIERPVLSIEETSPLALIKAQRIDAAPSTVFEISVDGLAGDQEISLIAVAVLDEYDGAVFSTRGGFTPAGRVLPAPRDGRAGSDTPLTQTVTLASAYPFRVLPVAGNLAEVLTPGLLWNRGTRTLASLNPPGGFTLGLEGTGRDLVPEDSLDETPAHLQALAETPVDAPDQLRVVDRFLGSVLPSSEVDANSLLLVLAVLRGDGFGYNENAPGGHSMAALASYLDEGSDNLGSRVGFAEQSSASLAVIARRLGIPARVVVGYQLPRPLTEASPSAVVSEDMAHAWVEVWTAEGWARLDPTNTDNAVSTLIRREPTVAEEEAGADLAIPDAAAPPLLDPGLAEPGRSVLPLLGALLIFLLVGLPLAIVAAKWFRRRRRRGAQDPSIRVIGARRELDDRLIDLGMGSGPAETLIDLSARLESINLGESAGILARMAPVLDQALYSPEGATEQGADEAWDSVSVVMAEASGSASRAKRVTRPINPITLVRRRGEFR